MRLRVRGHGAARYDRCVALLSVTVVAAIGLAIAADRSNAAADARTNLFVVDTSTSMAGKPLEEAKRALLGGVAILPVGTRVGLRSFGGPCGEPGISRLPIGPFDQAAFGSAVESLSIGASGTPTPSALRAAAATLPATGDRTIIIVSDGESSCGSPCPVATELAAKLGSDFRIDAVGFRVPTSAEAELDCVARATGGTYVSVSDSAGLQRTLSQSTVPRVTALRVSPATFAAAAKGGSIGTVVRKTSGARVLYATSEAGLVRFTIERAAKGRKVDGTCRRPTSTNRGGQRCTRYVKLPGSFSHTGKKGQNRLVFTGRRRGARLPPGAYKLVATARSAAGNLAKSQRAKFRIVPR